MLPLVLLVSIIVCCWSSAVLESYLNSSEWWMVKNLTNANVYYRSENKLVFLRRADLDVHNVHSCYEYAAFDKFSEELLKTRSFCFPSVIVGGYKKCSTSALYEFLKESPMFNYGKGKEVCAVKRPLLELFDGFPEEVTDSRYFINGCIYWDNNYVIHEVLRHPNALFIMIYRNYADYLWSAYNYWCSYPYDSKCTHDGEWLEVGKFTRSPTIFEDLVHAAAVNKSVLMPHYMVDSCNVGNHLFTNYTLSMWQSGVLPESTLLLANEVLDSHPEEIWHRISTAVGFTADHPKLEHFSHVKINANMKKGGKTAVDASKVTPGVYEISGFKPMMTRTRETLDKCWVKDCQFVSALTEHSYPVCQNVSLPVKYTESDQRYIDEYKATRLNPAYTSGHSFAVVKVNQCRELAEKHSHNHNNNGKVASTGSSTMVLLLSTSGARKMLGSFLAHYLTSDHHVSTHDVDTSTNRSALCSWNVPGVMIVTAHPDNVTIADTGSSSGSSNSTRQVGVKFAASVCPSSVLFRHVVVLLQDSDDYLIQAWKQVNSPTLWERNITAQLKKFDLAATEGMWASRISHPLQSMSSSQRLLMHLRAIRRDRENNYLNVLKKFSDFLFVDSVVKPLLPMVVTTLPIPSDLAPHRAVDLMYCAHLRVLETLTEEVERQHFRTTWVEGTHQLSNVTRSVYSDVAQVCKAEMYLQGRPLALASLRPTLGGQSYCNLKEAEVPSLVMPNTLLKAKPVLTKTHIDVPHLTPKQPIMAAHHPTLKPAIAPPLMTPHSRSSASPVILEKLTKANKNHGHSS